MDLILSLFGLITILIFVIRRDLRREMIVAGLLVTPVILIKPYIASEYYAVGQQYGGIFYYVLTRFLQAFFFGALSVALYEFIFRQYISHSHHKRRHLLLLLIGPLLFIILSLAHVPLLLGLLIAVIIDALLLVSFRRDLIWDGLFSSLAMAGLYLIVYLLSQKTVPGQISHLWFSQGLSGITFAGIPVEEVAAAALLGALIGPLYPAIKSHWSPVSDDLYQVSWVKKSIGQLFLGLLLFLVGITSYQFAFPPGIVAAPGENEQRVGVHEPMSIDFNRPIKRRLVSVTLQSTDGSHKPEVSLALTSGRLSRRVRFMSATPLQPDTEYTITVDNIHSVFGTKHQPITLSFRTKTRPSIVSTTPVEGADRIPVCDKITVAFDQPLEANSVTYSLSPEIPFSVDATDLTKHVLQPQQCLATDSAYTFSVLVDPNANKTAHTINFKTKAGLHITSYAPSGNGVGLDNASVEINFSDPMQTESELPSISPSVDGQWSWENDTLLRYKLNGTLPAQTQFTVTLPQGMKTKANESLSEKVVVTFRTIGPPSVAKSSPSNSAKEVKTNTPISFTFNQTVDHTTAQDAFSINPNVSGQFSWQGLTMTFIPNSLATNTTYTVGLKAGIKGLYNLVSELPFTLSFTTETTTTLLNIGQDYQDQALSCEAAALKMALVFKGVSVSEGAIMNHVGYDPTVRSGNQWGDPNVAFVGSINGKQNSTGYGVHWDPIARAANALGRKATAFSGLTPSQLAREISQNNPVVIWGVQGRASYDPWTTPGGKLIAAWKGEHARTVIGFRGTVENPTHFIINDPIAGRITWTTAQLKSNWSTFNNSGVIVF